MAIRYEYYTSDADGSYYVADNAVYDILSQSFTPSVSHTITSVKLRLARAYTAPDNHIGTVYVGIYAVDASHHPTGSALCSGSTNGDSLPDYPTFTLTEITLGSGADIDASTEYAIRLTCPNAGVECVLHWEADITSPAYTGGIGAVHRTSEDDWAGTGGTDIDFMFEEWGDALAVPVVVTLPVSGIAGITATGRGNITDFGYATPTAHGVCWNTTGTPTTSDSHTDEGAPSATGVFDSLMTSLTRGTTYYVRAYATNSAGTGYGSNVAFIAAEGEIQGVISIVETRLHYVDAYGAERYLEGTVIPED